MNPDELIGYFEEACDREAVLFVPDSPRQEKVAESLIKFHSKHYSLDILKNCVDYYCKVSPKPVTVYEFAITINQVRDKVIKERALIKDFEDKVEATRKVMEGD